MTRFSVGCFVIHCLITKPVLTMSFHFILLRSGGQSIEPTNELRFVKMCRMYAYRQTKTNYFYSEVYVVNTVDTAYKINYINGGDVQRKNVVNNVDK